MNWMYAIMPTNLFGFCVLESDFFKALHRVNSERRSEEMLDHIEQESYPAQRHPTTEAVHAGEVAPRQGSQPLAQPIYQTTVYSFDSLEGLDRVQEQPDEGWFYYRYDSPNSVAFSEAMARLEGAEAATTAGSGMGAIMAAFSGVLKAGDHIIADEKIYGGTFSLLTQQLPKFGIETTFVDVTDELAVRAAHRQTSRILYAETITNPLLNVTDLQYLVGLAHDLNLLTFVDATFSTPIICRPAQWGVDIVLHASTKYIGGHSDALGGVIAGRRDLVEAAHTAAKVMGLTQSPFDAWLNVRSLKTLPLRMAAHSRNAQTLAEWLEGQPNVSRVIYPGLASHPQHETGRKYMPDGLFGGMLSFEIEGGRPAVSRFIRALKDIPLVPSLADVTTTISHPSSTSHRMLSPEQRATVGVKDELLRLSVGIEDAADLIYDLDQALKAAR